MTDPDPIVQAVAEALHADQCPDDECNGGDMGECERMAEIAVATARPLIGAEAWNEGLVAGVNADMGDWYHPPEEIANPYRIEGQR